MKRVWKKRRRLHEVLDEWSTEAVNGDGGRYRRARVPRTGRCASFNGPGWQVRWLGTADRMEADLVPKHGIDIDFIRISGLRGKGVKALLAAPLRILTRRQARAIMKRFKPDVVLGMGGYVSGPGSLAAWSLGIPVVLHEQNGIAGLTNQWLAKIATTVMQAFPGAFPNAEVVGNPVRTDVLALPLPQVRLAGRDGPIRVLVVGGSQGRES